MGMSSRKSGLHLLLCVEWEKGVEVRGQLVEVAPLIPSRGFQGPNSVIRLGGKCLQLERHLASPSLVRDSFSGYNIFT